MKRIFTTSTFLIALLAIGLIGINNNNHNNSIGNAFAQMDPEDSAMMEDMEMNEDMMAMSNQSDGMKMMNWTGTIDVKSTIGEAFKSKVTVNIIDAIKTALVNVGLNSTVKEAELTPAHGYLVYKIMVIDENMKKYKVIVDPGNGQVLMKKEVTWYDDDEEHKMKYGEEKYNKYNHDDDYDQKKMMKMTKDEKY
ncbi:MAG: PepSY domain-containing protein [Nitrososphaeraceae archaeon]|nr:PepSY domain-containing protein [Nitrososphaeraceae archaeon]